MKRTPFSDWPCSVARTVDFLGDWWTPLVLREAFLGATRFDEFQTALSIGRNVLTQRLNRLVDEGLLVREKYQDRPPRFDYHLTDKGLDFFDVIAALLRWGDRWLDAGAGPPLLMRHKCCGQIILPKTICSCCGEPLVSADVEHYPGPGMATDVARRFRERAKLRLAKTRPSDPHPSLSHKEDGA